MRILCKFLPLNFDHLQNFIAPIIYSPMFNEQEAIQLNNERFRMIQQAKRTCLHISLSAYEMKLEESNQHYQEVFNQLESLLLNNTSVHGASLLDDIAHYISCRTIQLKQDISKRMIIFRGKLLHNRQRSASTKNTIGVSPESYLDLNFNPFNTLEWDHLSYGPSCIRLNQSAMRPQKQQKIEIKNEHQGISTQVQNNLVEYRHIPREQQIFQEYSNQLLQYLDHSYFTPLPYKDQIQAVQQANILASIRRKIHQYNLVIRVTDKSNNFYIGSAIEFEKKIQNYFNETNAYMELSDNPFNEIINKVIQLLNHLRSKKFILKWQYDQMMPDQKKVELAHLYTPGKK